MKHRDITVQKIQPACSENIFPWFFFLISMLAISFVFVSQGNESGGITYLFIRYHIQFMILLGFIGIGVGVSSYFSFRSQQEDVKATHANASEIVLRFLDDTEKIIIKKLINGSINQSELSRTIGKVKTFRTLQLLEQKGLIKLEEQGKTKRVNLHEDIAKLFL